MKETKTSLSFYSSAPITKVILAILRDLNSGPIKAFFPHKYAKKYGYSYLYKNSYNNSLHYLKRKGLIEKDRKNIYRLTRRGEKEAFFAYLNAESSGYMTRPQKWDHKWRIIFFDIPEKKRHYRDYLRRVLKAVGFKEFQKSIWIFPYPIPKFIKDLLWEENIKKYTRFITTESIEYDKDLQNLFNIKS